MSNKHREKVIERLEKIRARHRKVLTPNAVVEDARDPDSPLHRYFEWDDTKAAQKWRLEQARNLIAQFRVEVVTTSQTIAVPHYVHDPRVLAGKQGYAPVAEIRDKKTVALAALEYEFIRAMAALERAYEVAVGLDLHDQFRKLMAEAETVKMCIQASKPKGKGKGQRDQPPQLN